METRGSKVYFTIEEQLASGLPSPIEVSEANIDRAQIDAAVHETEVCSAEVADDEGLDPNKSAMARQNLMNSINKASILKRMHAELNPASLGSLFDHFGQTSD